MQPDPFAGAHAQPAYSGDRRIEDRARVLRGLDLGVNDFLSRPIDRNELLARTRTQLRHKRYADSLRNKVQQSIELALVDPLTGLNNRRFLENHLATMLDHAQRRRAPLSLMIFDIDHFKNVNDTHGHDAGDEVLKGFADRLRRVIRGGDLLCRLGGEEFVIAMPNVSIETAMKVAERTRSAIEEEPFVIDKAGRTIAITVSIGVAGRGPEGDPEFPLSAGRSRALQVEIGGAQPRERRRGLIIHLLRTHD